MHSTMRIGLVTGTLVLASIGLSGCSSIVQQRGFLVDQVLVASVQPGLDNKQSVRGTLGQPTLTSQFGDEIWYYVSSRTSQAPFTTPKISDHQVMAITFDESGTVATFERTGMENVVHFSPESDVTPTLGRERGLLEDLFGNIGRVGVPGTGS